MTGSITVDEAREKKFVATKVFEGATFSIHKWHSNAKELEGDSLSSSEFEDVSYAKQQLGRREIKGNLLGLPGNRETDTFSVALNVKDCNTKGGILSDIASVYDPLGLVSPTTLVAKLLYRHI